MDVFSQFIINYHKKLMYFAIEFRKKTDIFHKIIDFTIEIWLGPLYRFIAVRPFISPKFYSETVHRISLIFGPTDFGGWSYRFTAVRPSVRSFVRSFSRKPFIGFL